MQQQDRRSVCGDVAKKTRDAAAPPIWTLFLDP